jgi:hypothetical protein
MVTPWVEHKHLRGIRISGAHTSADDLYIQVAQCEASASCHP